MEQYIRELNCSRIIAGYVRYNKELRIYWPTVDLLYEASEIYSEVFNEARDEGLLTTSELISELVVGGLLEPDIDAQITELGKELDNLKVQCYHKLETPELKGIKANISRTKYRIHKLTAEQHRYDHLSAEGVAVFAKWTYILENSVYYKDGRQYKPDNDLGVLTLLEFWNATRLTEEELRELSRTDPWQTYWYASGNSMFGKPDCELTEEQRRLVIWSKHYDNIRESPEAPDENVMQDDDALDGWLIIQRKKRERDKMQQKIDSNIKSDKIRNANDIFIPARDKQHAQEIDALNDDKTRMLKNMRLKKAMSNNDDLSDMKMRMKMKD